MTLDKESDIRHLNDSLAVKLFHTEAIRYSKNQHLVAYSFFHKKGDCWERIADFGYSETQVGALGEGYNKSSISSEGFTYKVKFRIDRLEMP